ncbi:MAG: tyrosine-type recombinase/integrase [Thermodesulfobacteriota bacterium]
MKGGIYTKERCPLCGEKFVRTENDLQCTIHQTRPRRLYLVLYSKELGKHMKLYFDSRGIPFSSYEQADRILTKIRAEIDAGSFDPSRYVPTKLKPLQLTNYAEKWLKDREAEVEKRVLSPSYLKELRRFVRIFQEHFGATDIRDIGTRRVKEFYLSLKGSPKYISNVLSALHKMMVDALDYGDISTMPKFPEFEIPEADFRTIDLDQQNAIIQAIPNPIDRAYVLFTARQMVRPSETRALFWEDVDFKYDRVTIRRHFSLNELRETTKSKRIKILPLNLEVREALMRLPRHIRSPFVFQKDGLPYSESYARKLWNRITSGMGVKNFFLPGDKTLVSYRSS